MGLESAHPAFFLPLVHGSEILKAITIPIFTGVIGYIINWTGVWMLFHPIRFVGFQVPGLAQLARLLPRRLQEIPGIMHGGVGWQGIIPSRAAKMGSIAADKGLAKLGTPGEFYEQLEPEVIAEHILATSRRDIRDVVERIMEREHSQLWHDLPPRVREAVHRRVQQQLPDIVRNVTAEMGSHIDQLLDVKLMVIRKFEENPKLATRAFLEIGQRELRLMINFGFIFGFLLGIPVVFLVDLVPHWWMLPVCGVVVGWVTNLLGMQLIFEPVEPRRIGRSSSTVFSCAAARRSRRSTRRSSPTTSSPWATSASTSSTGLAPIGRGSCWRTPCARPWTGRRESPARRSAWRWGRGSTTRSATRSPSKPWTTR
jgi:uncharacterized membrane protein YheB (UPF0754 family)